MASPDKSKKSKKQKHISCETSTFCLSLNDLQSISKRRRISATNIDLYVDGKMFSCHRNELMISSSYFMELLNSSRHQGNNTSVVEINDVSSSIMELILNYIYTGSVTIATSNVDSLLEAAILFRIGHLADWCVQFTLDHIDVSTCLGVWQKMESLDLTDASNKAKKYALGNFRLVCKESNFIELSKESLIKLLSDEFLSVESENTIGYAVLSWLLHARAERMADFGDVLMTVNIQAITSAILINRLKSQLVRINDAVSRDLLKRFADNMQSDNPCSRRYQVVGIIGGLRPNSKHNQKVHYYNPVGNTWKTLTQIPKDYQIESAVVYGNIIITHQNRVMRMFNLETREWSDLHNQVAVRRPQCKMSKMLALDNKVYFIGGLDKSGTDGGFICYDLINHCELPVAQMEWSGVQFSCVVAYHGKIYAFDEASEEIDHISAIHCYDPNTNQWQRAGDIPEGFPVNSQAVVFDKFIYIFHDAGSIHVYHPSEDQWLPRIQGPDDYEAYIGSFGTVCNCMLYIPSKQYGADGLEYYYMCVYDLVHYYWRVKTVMKSVYNASCVTLLV
uniref:Kelch-like protein 24-like n=1 Tax=Saccoglossus kowalevskii TaxID=10224 RepID=A0ABM0MY32_SACKO|nr:PREDICTED: kelch-like protein 24-like [Saccoglossus kowalevskii]